MRRTLQWIRPGLLVLTLASCHTWRPLQAPTFPGASTGASTLAVTLTSGRVVRIDHGRVVGDTLRGDTLDEPRYGPSGVRAPFERLPVVLPLADVRSVARREFSPRKTVLLLVVPIAIPYVLYRICEMQSKPCGFLNIM